MTKKQDLKFDLDSYPFTVRRLSEDDGGGYLVEYPDVSRCASDGETLEEAIRNGRDALQASLEALAEFGHQIPKPGGAQSSGQLRQRVPKSLHARLVDRATREGVSLNALVTAMIAERMGRRDRSPKARMPSRGL